MRIFLVASLLCSGCLDDVDESESGQTLTATCSQNVDAQSCLQNFFNNGTAADTYVLPAGTYLHSGVLNIKGRVRGAGVGKTILKALDPSQRAVRLNGSGVSLSNMTLTTSTSSRMSTKQSGGVWIDTNVTNFELAYLEIHGKGGATGVMNYGGSFGKIHNLFVHDTNADCIHNTNTAHDIEIYDNHMERCGDDSIAVVGYSTSSQPYNINIHDNTALFQVGGRGLTCVGGRDVQIVHNHVADTTNGRAGIYIAAEPAYGSVACYRVTVRNNTVKRAGSTTIGHAAISVWNGSGSPNMKDITIRDNQGYANPNGRFIRVWGSNTIGTMTIANNVAYQTGGVAVSIEMSVSPLTNSGNSVKPLSPYPGDIAPANSSSVAIQPTSSTQAPYGGTPRAIPGTIEAEDFDSGGEGVAYHDSDTVNHGGAYRASEGVDIKPSTDPTGGYAVGYLTAPGEWLEYTVNVTQAGKYAFDARVATVAAGKSFHVEIDGVNVTGTIAVPVTATQWNTTYGTTAVKSNIALTAGSHVVRLYADTDAIDIDWLRFRRMAPVRINAGMSTAYTDSAGNVWSPDTYANGGSVADRGTSLAIANTSDPRLYQTERWCSAGYAIPVLNGTYTVRLHFAETSPGVSSVGQRVFDIALEGSTVLANFDPLTQAAKYTALVKSFTATVGDGVLDLGLRNVVGCNEINAIELVP